MKRLATVITFGLLFVIVPGNAIAAGPSYFQGFEVNTAGWCDTAPCDGVTTGTITRQPSGYTNGGGYADGIASAAGGFHARLGTPSDPGCNPGMGGSQCDGPYSHLGLTNDAVFPEPGYFTQQDVYLDTGFAATNNDYRFDVESAINNTSGSYLQGFDFNVGTTSGGPGFVVGASTNATRSGAFPANPCPNPSTAPNYCRVPVTITTSGWYSFRHTFTDVGGALEVRLQVFDSSNTLVPGADWTITSANPISITGGPRLAWFPNQEIDDLAIDNTRATAFSDVSTNLTCNGVIPGGVYYDVIVPDDGVCVLDHVTVKHDVRAKKRAYIEVIGGSVGHDLTGEGSTTVYVHDGAVITHYLQAKGGTQQLFAFDSTITDGKIKADGVQKTYGQVNICGMTVQKGNIEVTNSGSDILVGDPLTTDCAGNTVQNDIKIQKNQTYVELIARGNSVGHNMTVTDNKGPSDKAVESNSGGNTLDCHNNQTPFAASANTGWVQKKGQCAGP